MKVTYRHAATASGLVCLGLSVVWLFSPSLLLDAWQLPLAEGTSLVGRRGAAFLLALAIILLLSRHEAPSPLRRAISRGMIVGYFLLAALGIYEFLAGHASGGILPAALVEVLLALAFLSGERDGPSTT